MAPGRGDEPDPLLFGPPAPYPVLATRDASTKALSPDGTATAGCQRMCVAIFLTGIGEPRAGVRIAEACGTVLPGPEPGR
jgi:hypothetical protein